MQQPRILVVEDNPVEQRIVSVIAGRCGFAVDVAATAYKALELLDSNAEYAAVLMNCMLPAMNGMECAQAIRQSEGSDNHLPIIAVTAFTLDDAREQCIAAGMDDYLPKPYSLQDFELMLNRWARKAPLTTH